MNDYILVIGSSMIDIYGYSPKRNIGCNLGDVKISFGGVSRNIVENLLRINVNTMFISVFGDDLFGIKMYKQLESLGCDLTNSLFIKNHQSASFMAITDEHNHVLSAIADNKIMKYLTFAYLKSHEELIKNAKYIVFDSNDYDIFNNFVSYFKDVNIIFDPVSPIKAEKIKQLLPFIHTIKPNRKEAEVLCGFEIRNEDDINKAGSYLLSIGVKNIFITLDKDGVYFNDGIDSGIIKAENISVLNDVGAGDAFVAGICYSYINDLSFIDTVKFSYSSSILALNSINTVNEQINKERVLDIVENTKWKYRGCNEIK